MPEWMKVTLMALLFGVVLAGIWAYVAFGGPLPTLSTTFLTDTFFKQFVFLTLVYFLAFTLFRVLKGCWQPACNGTSRVRWKQSCIEAMKRFGVQGKGANLVWDYFLWMFIITFVIGIITLPVPLFWRETQNVAGNESGNAAQEQINYVLFGNPHPDPSKTSFFPPFPKKPGAVEEQSKPAPTPLPAIAVKRSIWFWQKADGLYWVILVILFPVAFWDETWAFIRGGFEALVKGLEKHAERRQKIAEAAAAAAAQQTKAAAGTAAATAAPTGGAPAAAATINMSAPPPTGKWSMSILREALAAGILTEVFEAAIRAFWHTRQERRTVNA